MDNSRLRVKQVLVFDVGIVRKVSSVEERTRRMDAGIVEETGLHAL